MTTDATPEPLGAADPVMARRVEAMAGYGIPAEDIATVMGIDVGTLRRTYQTELAGAAIKANARVAESLFRKATGDGREGVIAAIFWMKTRAGWRESIDHRIEGAPTFVARIPEPVASVDEWISLYTPRTVSDERK
jgi:hypothetical protein